ncbi:class E sortase [Streptomyces sp. NPDC050856]|uniref:class E sortase n=1 Tax=Streptomyces sp. NPDC050856 TaxID=3154939 RepID=UPI0033C36662
MHSYRTLPAALAAVAAAVGCAAAPASASAPVPPPSASGRTVAVSSPADAPGRAAVPAPVAVAASPGRPAADKTDPRTETALLAIPSIGLRDLRVVPYAGTTDDWAGTRIQDRGVAASPYGRHGGVGPGEVGNYLVTAHRLSAGGPLRDLPALAEGDLVLVTSGGRVHEYRITDTRQTSFRSERSLAEQRADVPGAPGRKPVKAMITISTCATPEDDAAGNFWRDEKGNPEHRIDKIGELVSSRKAP